MPRLVNILLLSAALIFAIVLCSCDTTADRELGRAERALNDALEVNSDSYAPEDYTAAEELFQEAMDLSRDNRIQEARATAIKAKLRAEDAKRKADERHRILQDEMDRIGR